MKSIRSTLLNRHLGSVLTAVHQGETYVVTNHGRPFVVISPAAIDMDLTEVTESKIGQKKSAAEAEGESAA